MIGFVVRAGLRAYARARGYLWARRERAAIHDANLALDWEHHAERERRDARALTGLAAVCVLGVLLWLLFGCVGCGAGDPLPPPDPPAPADAGTADATGPQCQPVTPGDEFDVRDRQGAPVVLIRNLSCDRVCQNTAGGQSCGKAGALVRCADCEAP